MSEENIYRLWKPIGFEDAWRDTDTSILDDLSSAWFARRARLRLDSKGYVDFLERLKREHAIETGVVERLYDIDRGVTETLIQQGFVEGFLSHGDANIPSDQLMRHLKDHLEALDFVFDMIKEERPLTTGYIKELHQLVTRSQLAAEGRDSLGNRTQIKLLKGTFKEWENNPTRSDGKVIMYCPPIQVASEMDQLVHIYHALEEEKLHPLIIAAWVHHAFTTIHPFQDGNGRVVRLLASLILIKHNLFPITVLREEAKLKYILALEKADAGEPNEFVRYFAVIQKRQIERALNFEEVVNPSLETAQELLALKLGERRQREREQRIKLLNASRNSLFELCQQIIEELRQSLIESLGENASVSLINSSFDNVKKNKTGVFQRDYFFAQIVDFAKRNKYFFNATLPKAWIKLSIEVGNKQVYHLVFSMHHFGFDESSIAIGSFFEIRQYGQVGVENVVLPIDLPPHVVSIGGTDIASQHKNIRRYLEDALTIAISYLIREL